MRKTKKDPATIIDCNDKNKVDYTFAWHHLERCLAHYEHARKKHSYFCDQLLPGASYGGDVGEEIMDNLAAIRKRICRAIRARRLEWDELLNEEVWEVHMAVERGDKAHAVEELYDCIAVLLRVVDVLEGRQPLGRAKGGSDA